MPRTHQFDPGAATEGRPYRPKTWCLCFFCFSAHWLSIAPISVPEGVPALIKSLPGASLRKLPRFILPSELRETDGVRLTKSAELTTRPFPLVLTPLIHQQFVFATSVPLCLSLCPLWNERLLVNT